MTKKRKVKKRTETTEYSFELMKRQFDSNNISIYFEI